MHRGPEGNHVLMHGPAHQCVSPQLICLSKADLLGQEIHTVVVVGILSVFALAGLGCCGADILSDGASEESDGFVRGGVGGAHYGSHDRGCCADEGVDGPLPIFEGGGVGLDLTVGVILIPEAQLDREGEAEGSEVEHDAVSGISMWF